MSAYRHPNRSYWNSKGDNNPALRYLTQIEGIAGDYAAGTEARSYLFVGIPGCGWRSFIERILAAENVRFARVRIDGSWEALADKLQECARTGTIVLFDGAEDITRNRRHLQVLSSAIQPQRRGERRFFEKTLPGRRPRGWCFDELIMCFFANQPISIFAAEPRSAIMRDFLDCCIPLEQDRSSKEEIFNFICYMVIVREHMKPLGFSMATINTMLAFVTEHRNELPLSLRLVEDLAVGIVSSPDGWRAAAETKLKKTRSKTFDVPVAPRIIPAPKKAKASRPVWMKSAADARVAEVPRTSGRTTPALNIVLPYCTVENGAASAPANYTSVTASGVEAYGEERICRSPEDAKTKTADRPKAGKLHLRFRRDGKFVGPEIERKIVTLLVNEWKLTSMPSAGYARAQAISRIATNIRGKFELDRLGSAKANQIIKNASVVEDLIANRH